MGQGQHAITADRLDAANTSRNAGFRDDFEQANVTGAGHMGATTQLARASNIQHPNLIAIFFAKQGHDTALDRIVKTHELSLGVCVGQYLGIHHCLDSAHLIGRDRLVV